MPKDGSVFFKPSKFSKALNYFNCFLSFLTDFWVLSEVPEWFPHLLRRQGRHAFHSDCSFFGMVCLRWLCLLQSVWKKQSTQRSFHTYLVMRALNRSTVMMGVRWHWNCWRVWKAFTKNWWLIFKNYKPYSVVAKTLKDWIGMSNYVILLHKQFLLLVLAPFWCQMNV